MRTPEPFFRQGEFAPGAPRLLLLSYHFPPGQAAGARRWEKLAHFAAARGYALDVFTLDPKDLPAPDPARLGALPAGTRVYGVGQRRSGLARAAERALAPLRALRRAAAGAAREPRSGGETRPAGAPGAALWVPREALRWDLLSLSGWRRAGAAALEIADDAAWSDAAAAAARAVFDPRLHRAVVSCGPPHGVHRAGRRLSARLGLPLVVDMRDVWSLAERVHASAASPLRPRLAGWIESRAFARAALVVMNTPAARDAMRRAHPRHAAKILCVANGFDDEALPERAQGDVFVIAYAGTIYIDRSPRNLFRAVRAVADALGLGRSDLRVELMGHLEAIDGHGVAEIARQEGVEDLVVLHPPASAREAAALLARAAVLVNLPQDSHLAVPSKVYEYMVFPAWLLALAEPGSATEQILAGTGAAVVDPADVPGMTRALRGWLEAYRAGARPEPVAKHARLGRAHQAALLFDAIEERIGRPAALATSNASRAPVR